MDTSRNAYIQYDIDSKFKLVTKIDEQLSKLYDRKQRLMEQIYELQEEMNPKKKDKKVN